MRITFDPAKREATLAKRGVDFADAETVFAGPTFSVVDDRFDYGETRPDLRTVVWPDGPGGLDRAG